MAENANAQEHDIDPGPWGIGTTDGKQQIQFNHITQLDVSDGNITVELPNKERLRVPKTFKKVDIYSSDKPVKVKRDANTTVNGEPVTRDAEIPGIERA